MYSTTVDFLVTFVSNPFEVQSGEPYVIGSAHLKVELYALGAECINALDYFGVQVQDVYGDAVLIPYGIGHKSLCGNLFESTQVIAHEPDVIGFSKEFFNFALNLLRDFSVEIDCCKVTDVVDKCSFVFDAR